MLEWASYLAEHWPGLAGLALGGVAIIRVTRWVQTSETRLAALEAWRMAHSDESADVISRFAASTSRIPVNEHRLETLERSIGKTEAALGRLEAKIDDQTRTIIDVIRDVVKR